MNGFPTTNGKLAGSRAILRRTRSALSHVPTLPI